jgi:hypothetical protein
MSSPLAAKHAAQATPGEQRQRRSAMRLFLATLLATGVTASAGGLRVEEAQLCFEPRFILEAVAQRMNVALRPEVPLPSIFLASATPLRQFRDAIRTQWRFEPEVVSNTYAIARNEIYLLDDASYYLRYRRTLDDSLAHEFVHYLQATHLREDLSSEWTEAEAVAVQNWFRQEYGHCGASEHPRSARADSRPG